MTIKLFKIFISILGVFCVSIFILARFDKIPIWLADKELIEADETGKYGDLFFLCRVDYFKTELPRLQVPFNITNKKSDINGADILIYGDSYFAGSRVLKTFPELIHDSLNIKVYFEQETFPLKSLLKNKYVKSKSRVLLYEATERRILQDFRNVHTSFTDEKLLLSDIFDNIIPYNQEMKYLSILQKSIFTSSIYSSIMNFRFNTLGLISDLTPLYSKDPPFLFYYQNVNNKNSSFYYKFSDEEIITVANNIFQLNETLRNDFNIELVFMPIPSSYTINSKYINNDKYNGLLQRLYIELQNRNVSTVKLLERFYKSNKILYYQTDTHWNDDGIKIAFEELKFVLNNHY